MNKTTNKIVSYAKDGAKLSKKDFIHKTSIIGVVMMDYGVASILSNCDFPVYINFIDPDASESS